MLCAGGAAFQPPCFSREGKGRLESRPSIAALFVVVRFDFYRWRFRLAPIAIALAHGVTFAARFFAVAIDLSNGFSIANGLPSVAFCLARGVTFAARFFAVSIDFSNGVSVANGFPSVAISRSSRFSGQLRRS